MAGVTDMVSKMSQEEFDEYFREYIKTQNYSQSKDTWKELPTWEVGLKISIAVVILLVSLVGNGLVLAALQRKKSLRSVTNLFIINLVIADLLVTLSVTWIQLVDELSNGWLLGPVLCKYNPMLGEVAFISSVLTMTAISMERFFGIVTPFMFCSYKREKMILTAVAIWLTAVAVATPLSVYTEQETRDWVDFREVWCVSRWQSVAPNSEVAASIRKAYFTVRFCILYALPMLIMTAAYSAIMVKLRAKASEITELNHNLQKQKLNSRRRVIFMLIVLLTAFTICWLPVQVFTLLYEHRLHKVYYINGEWELFHKLSFGVKFLANANSACNPVIFICFSQKIRKEQPHIEQLHIEQPHIEQPHIEQPHIKQPHIEQPLIEQPHLEQAHIEQPHIEQPHIEQPHIEQPHIEQPHIKHQRLH
ncbi:QRFP-like peptide receptor [Watersipora subatra]|uniref:QRFP-like peptide receptor n=1 Tax=Watersipora subatra TaxID=2589382 RepID=UPI00355BC31D